MTRPASTYRVSVVCGSAAGPLALVAANVAALLSWGYRVWVRDPDDRVVAVHRSDEQLHLSFRPGPVRTCPCAPCGRARQYTA